MTPDQMSLVALADQVLRGRSSNDQLTAAEAAGWDERLWAELSAAGLVGIGIPEEYGGAGLGLAEVCLLLEQHGRRLALVPLWENAVAALAVARFGDEALRKRWLPGVAEGVVRLSVAVEPTVSLMVGPSGLRGTTSAVPFGMTAEAALVVADDAIWVVELDGVERTPVETMTHGVAADLTFEDTPAERLSENTGWVADVARVGLAAMQLGNADEGIREAAAYLSQREQFGRSLATFQAVSQQLGDAYCEVQAMRATLWQAVWTLEQGSDARRAVDVAAWWATDAGVRVQVAVQHLHGGIGADTTYPIHRRLLRALEIDARLGGASRQLARLGASLV